MQGSVANFVESEQLIVLEDKEGNFTTSSFVQIRGSIPLLWSQIPNIKYKPPTRIAPPSAYQAAFDRHFKTLLEAYQVTVCPCILHRCKVYDATSQLLSAYQAAFDRQKTVSADS